jgi:hypothetical protein
MATIDFDHDHLVNFARQGDIVDFERHSNALHSWIRARLHLSGGWLPEIDRSYFPKTPSLYAFSSTSTERIRQVSINVARLYQKIGYQIGQYFDGYLLGRDWPFDNFSSAERTVLQRVGLPRSWAPMLRPDIIINEDNTPKIIEVNVDNPAGFEELVMYLRFYDNVVGDESEYSTRIRSTLNSLLMNFKWWIDAQYKLFLQSLTSDEAEHFGVHPRIAVVYEDLEDSFFLSRYLTAFLNELGYKAIACRPEHVKLSEHGLSVEAPASGQPVPIDLVIRDWLFDEMFEEQNGDEKRLKPHFEVFIQAVERNAALILNPLSERLLFSKALLAELHSDVYGIFSLTPEDRRFVNDHIVKTWLVDTLPSADALANMVLKPASLCSGQNVFVGGETDPNLVPNIDQSSDIWVGQEKVLGKRQEALFRLSEAKISTEQLFVTHGALVYDNSGGQYVLGGVMTKASLDPVVSFQRGAQLVPSLLAMDR